MPDYYAHQHAQTAKTKSTVVPVSEHYASKGQVPRDGSGGVDHANGAVQRAPQAIMRGYVKPKRRLKDNPDRPLCQADDCKAYPMHDLEYCTGHARSMGLIENWKKAGREAS